MRIEYFFEQILLKTNEQSTGAKDCATVGAGSKTRLHCTIFTLFLISLISRTGSGKLILAIKLVLTVLSARVTGTFMFTRLFVLGVTTGVAAALSHACAS